jgi:hypothetical protein
MDTIEVSMLQLQGYIQTALNTVSKGLAGASTVGASLASRKDLSQVLGSNAGTGRSDPNYR